MITLSCLLFRGKVSKTTSMRDFDVMVTIRKQLIRLGAEIHANIVVPTMSGKGGLAAPQSISLTALPSP
jgi:hypothetical protein